MLPFGTQSGWFVSQAFDQPDERSAVSSQLLEQPALDLSRHANSNCLLAESVVGTSRVRDIRLPGLSLCSQIRLNRSTGSRFCRIRLSSRFLMEAVDTVLQVTEAVPDRHGAGCDNIHPVRHALHEANACTHKTGLDRSHEHRVAHCCSFAWSIALRMRST